MNKLYSLDKLKEIAQGDDTFVQDMIITFVETVSEEVKNIQKLLDADEWNAIRQTVHKLIINYAYMDAESLFALSADIENKIKNGSNLTEITALTRQLCADSLVLIDELKKI